MTHPSLESALAANADESFRKRQRICGLYLGLTQGEFTQKELRQLCKEHDACHAPTFSRSIKQDADWFVGDKTCWRLTDFGRSEAEQLFGAVETTEAPAEPEPAFEPEPALPEPQDDLDLHLEEAADEEAPETATEPQDEPVAALEVAAPQATAPAPTTAHRRLPRVRAANALASLFRQIKKEEQEGKKGTK
jgi:hypothetical protein